VSQQAQRADFFSGKTRVSGRDCLKLKQNLFPLFDFYEKSFYCHGPYTESIG
jgi:hypothetical protein